MKNKSLIDVVTRVKIARAEAKDRQNTVFDFMLRNSESIRAPNFRQLATQDLGLLFQVTDELFFDGHLGTACESLTRPLSFRLSKRMTTSGGMTTMTKTVNQRKDFEIAIATTPLFQSFRNPEVIKVGGVHCANRLQALQRIMEHEMIHLAEMLIWDDSNCGAVRFKTISNRLFAHTESNHQLLTPRDVAKKDFQIHVGDRVSFLIDGKSFSGVVSRITKRATILVNDQNGILYSDGRKYIKFYVPLRCLKRVA